MAKQEDKTKPESMCLTSLLHLVKDVAESGGYFCLFIALLLRHFQNVQKLNSWEEPQGGRVIGEIGVEFGKNIDGHLINENLRGILLPFPCSH